MKKEELFNLFKDEEKIREIAKNIASKDFTLEDITFPANNELVTEVEKIMYVSQTIAKLIQHALALEIAEKEQFVHPAIYAEAHGITASALNYRVRKMKVVEITQDGGVIRYNINTPFPPDTSAKEQNKYWENLRKEKK